MKTRTIIFCCNSLWGLVNFRGRVIQALVADGHRVVLVACEDHPVERALALGAEFVAWDVAPRSTNPLKELGAIRQLVQIYKQVRPDIAFQFTVKPVIYGAIINRLTGIPCVSVITGLGYLFLGSGLKTALAKALYRWTLHRSHEAWFLNDDDRQMFEQAGLLDGLKVRTLPGEGVDVDHFAERSLPPVQPEFRFLMVARLVKDKGVLEYAAAAQVLRAEFPNVRFQLLGPPYLAKDASVSMDDIERWRREGTVDYLGATDDVRDAVANAHCVVLPSYREGMPRVLMEAASMGRPAVTTDVTGCRDVVTEDTAVLCTPRDGRSLADAMRRVLQLSANELATMGAAARALALARYDDRIIIDLYREVIASMD